MKNKMKIIIIFFAILSVFGIYSCSKKLDINADPNNPTDVSENLLLSGILGNFSYEVVGGYPVRNTALWTKHIAYATADRHPGNYWMTTGDVNNLWQSFSYNDVMSNCVGLISMAEENNNPKYSAIGQIILAWNMSIITDLFGDAPFSDAFKAGEGILKPKYDTQEEIYISIQSLLDEAIINAEKSDGLAPGNDDYVYKGKMENWINLAHSLKARFYLRLSNAPGHDAKSQAELAIAELEKGSINKQTQPIYNYLGSTGAENPWYQYAIDGKWSTTNRPSQYYVDLLLSREDPRLKFQADTVKSGDNMGQYVGVINEPPANSLVNYSAISEFYSAANAPLYMFPYPEVDFIKAEAEFIKAGKTVTSAVTAAYEKAVKSSFEFYGISNEDMISYLDNNRLSSDANEAYKQIMFEKYVSNYLQTEAYNDFRRTGYPELTINNDTYPGVPLDTEPSLDIIPLRFPYPNSERQYNSENIPNEIPIEPLSAMKIPVWWDAN